MIKDARYLLILCLLAVFVAACGWDDASQVATPGAAAPTTAPTGGESPSIDAATPDPAAVVTPTASSVPASPTPDLPLAATVNGQPIYLSTYEQELARYEQAQVELGLTPGDDDSNYRELVLNTLIEQALIAQEAQARNLEVTPAMVDEKINELRADAGDTANFDAWLQANQWTEAEFHEALAAEMLTEQVVEAVTADVPYAVEQVHARYLQVDDPALAQSLLEQARGGGDFAALAQQHSLDRVTGQNGGDLGFFAPGSLLVPEVEAAAFALQPGEISDVIAVAPPGGGPTTYYLVQLIERDPQRPLTADLRYAMLQEAFESWLATVQAEAEVVRFVETES